MEVTISLNNEKFSSMAQPVPAYPKQAISLYSKEYTTDRKARQMSIDFEGFKDYGSTLGLPDQMQLFPNVWIKLTKERQEWLFECLCLGAYGKGPASMTATQLKTAKSEWASFMHGGRCFTNKAGWNNGYADYIQGLNLGASPMQWEPLILGGNFIEVTGGNEGFSNTYLNFGRKSYQHYPIRAIDINNLPNPSTVVADRFIWHRATTIKPDGTTWVFPQFGERAGYPIWGTKNNVWVWENLIRFLN